VYVAVAGHAAEPKKKKGAGGVFWAGVAFFYAMVLLGTGKLTPRICHEAISP